MCHALLSFTGFKPVAPFLEADRTLPFNTVDNESTFDQSTNHTQKRVSTSSKFRIVILFLSKFQVSKCFLTMF